MSGSRAVAASVSGPGGLYTDLYELRMVQSYLRRGMTANATFSLFVRPTAKRPWYVAFGVHRVLEMLERFSYGRDELEYLASVDVDDATLGWLADLRPSGEVWAVPDGTVVLAHEPILEVTAPLPVAQLLETAVINLVQHSTLIATKAARCALAAGGRRLADFGLRRAHGLDTGVEAALAAYVGGGFATSNVEAGRRYGVPVTGTMAHSYVQAFPDEVAAFAAFAEDHPDNSVLLVDTYDPVQGVHNAIRAARENGTTLRGIRLDSGDLGDLATQARGILDDAGYRDTIIIASGGLEEHAIHELVRSGAPIDAFGVGTALTVSKDHPALDIVYKLVAYDDRAVAKFSDDKSILPGPKQVHRSAAGPETDVLSVRGADEQGVPLLGRVWHDGRRLARFDISGAKARVEAELGRLPGEWSLPPYCDQPPMPRVGDRLRELTEEVRTAALT